MSAGRAGATHRVDLADDALSFQVGRTLHDDADELMPEDSPVRVVAPGELDVRVADTGQPGTDQSR